MYVELDHRKIFIGAGSKSSLKELDPAKPGVLFLHGSGMDHTVWLLPKRHFIRLGYNVMAVDLPGHGRSDGPPLETIEQMAQWAKDLLSASNLESISVVGHSMGSLIAMRLAAIFPNFIKSLVLLGCIVPMEVTDVLLDSAREDSHDAMDMINVWGHGPWTQVGSSPTPGMWMLGSGIRLLEKSARGVLFNDLNACRQYTSGIEDASNIQCPVLLIQGDRDVMTPSRAARDLLGVLERKQVVKLGNCGHSIMAERPEQMLDALVDFL